MLENISHRVQENVLESWADPKKPKPVCSEWQSRWSAQTLTEQQGAQNLKNQETVHARAPRVRGSWGIGRDLAFGDSSGPFGSRG